MRYFAALCLLCVFAGCQTQNRQQILAGYELQCIRDYGFAFGSTELKQCVQQIDIAEQQRLQQNRQHLSNSLSNSLGRMANATRPTYVRPIVLPQPISPSNNWGAGWN